MADRLTIVVERAFEDDADLERAAAAEHGVDLVAADVSSGAELARAAADADGVIVRYLELTAADLEAGCWRVVGRYGIGVDNVDLAAASAQGVAVVNVPDYCVEEVATHAATLILAGWRRLPAAQRLVADGRWDAWTELAPIAPLSRCTLGLVGGGRIGTRLAQAVGPLFETILVHDPYADRPPAGAVAAELDELVARADVVSLHCPLTPETDRLFDAARLARMRPGSLLVNVSRGGLIDTAALAAALDTGRPAGAALDVMPVEPPDPADPLLRHPAVLVTNHVGWYSTQALDTLRTSVADRCAAYLVGGSVSSIVNRDALTEATR